MEGGSEKVGVAEAIAAPSRAACAAAAAASPWLSDCGSRSRDSSVLTRVAGAITTGARGRSAATRLACSPAPFCQIRHTPPFRGGGKVVGMPLERQSLDEQPAVLERQAGNDGGAGDEAGRDRCGARAESALERDPVDETEVEAVERRERAEGTQREVRGVGRKLAGPEALERHQRLSVGRGQDVQLVPEIERSRRAIEPRPEIGRRSRRTDHCPGTGADLKVGSRG